MRGNKINMSRTCWEFHFFFFLSFLSPPSEYLPGARKECSVSWCINRYVWRGKTGCLSHCRVNKELKQLLMVPEGILWICSWHFNPWSAKCKAVHHCKTWHTNYVASVPNKEEKFSIRNQEDVCVLIASHKHPLCSLLPECQYWQCHLCVFSCLCCLPKGMSLLWSSAAVPLLLPLKGTSTLSCKIF